MNLSKQRIVMERYPVNPQGPDVQRFVQHPEEEGEVARGVDVLTQDWEDMGRPDIVTVTIEPGDLLNGEEQ